MQSYGQKALNCVVVWVLTGVPLGAIAPANSTLAQIPAGASPSPLNPRPSIFDELPYRRSPRSVEPQPGLPSQELQPQQTQPAAAPLPETEQAPSAVVSPVNGSVSVKLTNTTNAAIAYQIIGDTNQRILAGKSDVTLQNLRVPVTITLSREDRGLLKPTVQATKGLLEVTLDATTNLDEDRTSIRVQQTGEVLLN